MEFEATYVVPRQRLRSLMRLYERRYPTGIRINLCQSRVYLDTPSRELYLSGRSACLTIDRTAGRCVLHKYGTKVFDGYVARHECKISLVAHLPVSQQIAAVCMRLALQGSGHPLLLLASTRKYVVLQTVPQPVLISFDSVQVSAANRRPLHSFSSIELECNGETVDDRFIDEVGRLRAVVDGDGLHIHSKYRYAYEQSEMN